MPEALKAHLQTRLFVLVLLAFLPALVLYWYATRETDALRSQVIDHQLIRSAEVAAIEYDRLIDESGALLSALSHVPAVRDMVAAECNTVLSNALSVTPWYTTLSRIGLDGYLACGSLTPEQQLYLGDRSYFIQATNLGQFAVGDYALGRITGRPGVGVALPVRTGAGESGVLAASIDLAAVAENALTVDLAEGASVTLLDAKGQVMVRYPIRPDPGIIDTVGTIVGEGFPAMPSTRGITLMDGVDLDGLSRRFAVSALVGSEGKARGYVVIGADRTELSVEVASITRTQNWILVVSAIALAALAWIWGHYFLVRRAVEAKREALAT